MKNLQTSRAVCAKLLSQLSFAAAFAIFLSGQSVQAASDTWVGSAGSADWNQATWTGGNVTPVSGDSLVFTGANASSSTTLTNTLATSFNFGTITFNAGALAYTMTGNTFNLTTGITNSGTNLETFSETGGLNLSSTTETFNVSPTGGISITTGVKNTFNGVQTITANGAGGTLTLGSYALSNNATARTDIINGSGNVVISGAVSNGGTAASGGLTYSGTGTLTLSGTNTYSGATTVSSGALNIQSAGALGGTSGVTVASGGALQIQGNITTTAATPITISGTGVTGSANGAIENVSGSNTYAGLVTLGAASTIGSDAGTLAFSNTGTIVGTSTGFGLTLTGAGNGSIAGIINGGITGTPGAGTLTKTGTGTWTVTGANTYTGATTVNAGTLADGNTLASTALVLGGGTFSNTSASTTQTFTTTTLNAGSSGVSDASTSGSLALGTITRNAGATLNVTNSSSGNVTAINANTNGILGGWATFGGTAFAVSGGNGTTAGNVTALSAYDQALTTAGDTNTAHNDNLAGSLAGLVTSSINSLTITDTTANDSITLGASNLTFTAGGGLLYSGGSAYAINATTGVIGAGTTNEFIVDVSSGGTLTFGGKVVSGTATAGSFTTGGAGTVTLTASQVYTGQTTVGAGTLNLGNGGAFTLDGGTYAANIAIGGGSLVFNSSSNQTFSGVISGSGALTKSGSGTLTLSGTNTFAGPITFNAGSVNVTDQNQLGTVPASYVANQLTFNGGTLTFFGSPTIAPNQGITLGAAGGTITETGANSVIINSIIAGGGALKLNVGSGVNRTITLNGANTYTGGTTISNNYVAVGNNSALGTGTVTLTGGGSIWAGNINLANNITVASGQSASIQNNSGNFTLSGAIFLAGSGDTLNFLFQTAGTTTTLTGGITGTGNLVFGNLNGRTSTNLNFNGATVNNVGTITNSTSDGAGSFRTFNAIIGSNVTGVIQNSANTGLVLNAANLYSSPTQINLGTLTTSTLANNGTASGIGVGSASPSAADLVFGVAGGSLVLNANTAPQTTNRLFTIGSSATTTGTGASATLDSSSALAANFVDFDGTGAIVLGATTSGVTNKLTLTGSNTGNNELDPILGDGTTGITSLVKSGAGKWILGGADTYTGTTTISAGTLQVGNGTTGSISNSTAITDNGTLAFDEGASPLTISNTITGTGGLTQIGGTTILLGTKAYTGATLISGGTLQFGNGTTNGRLATNSVITDNSTLLFDENTAVVQGTDFSSAAITGSGNVTVEGAGAVTLNAANSFSSLTDLGVVNVATVAASGTAQPLGTGLVTLAGVSSTTGVLNYTGGAGTLGNNLAVADGDQGTIINNSVSMLTLGSSLSTIALGSTGTASTLNLIGGTTSEGAFTVAAQITGSNANTNLNVVDAYALLSSANTYGGATSLYGKTSGNIPGFNVLRAGIAAALPSSTVVTLGNATVEGSNGFENILDLNGYSQTIAGLASSNDGHDFNYVVNGNSDYPSNFGLSATTPSSATLLTIAPTAGHTYTYGGVLGGAATSNNFGVAVAGSGTQVFTANNIYTGGTTVGNGSNSPTLLLRNGSSSSGSATGTGPLTVAANATIGGDGTSRSTGAFSIAGKVIVGNGTDATSQTTITGTASSNFTNANLTFNLNSAVAGQANQLNVETTDITFSNTTLTLNMLGNNFVSANTDYILIAGASSSQYSGLGLAGGNGIITSGLTINFADPTVASYYANSYLFVDNGNIEIAVVPEPGTWVLLMSGLTLLVVIQRRKKKQI